MPLPPLKFSRTQIGIFAVAVLLLGGRERVSFGAEHLYTDPPLSFYETKHAWVTKQEKEASGKSKVADAAPKAAEKKPAGNGHAPDWNGDETKVRPYTLPDLFTMGSGAKVETAAQWRERRRPELLELFRREVFGFGPERPADLTFQVEEVDPAALEGKATRKRVLLSFTVGGAPYSFHVDLFLPNARPGPFPVFLLMNHRGTGAPDPVALAATPYWPVAEGMARGYAMAVVYTAAEVDPDKPNATTGVRAFYREHAGKPEALTWGMLGAWAWSASRAMDYLVTDRDVDARQVAVIGQSRGGKTSLWAGAQDERFALVCVNCAGEGGPALARRNFGETLRQITAAFPHWFTPTYAGYASKVETLPVDAHELIALVAPRAYHGTDATEDLHSDPRGSWLALVEASRVWALLGAGTALGPEAQKTMPLVNDLFVAGPIAYHMRDGEHDLKRFDWKLYFDHADMLWGRHQHGSTQPAAEKESNPAK